VRNDLPAHAGDEKRSRRELTFDVRIRKHVRNVFNPLTLPAGDEKEGSMRINIYKKTCAFASLVQNLSTM